MDEARILLKRSIELDPGHAYSIVLLAQVEDAMARTRARKERCQEHIRRGIQRYRDGMFSRALLDFNMAVLEDPLSASAHFNLAAVHYKLGRFRQAEREVAQTLSLDPAHSGARYLSGLLYARSGAGSRALATFGDLAGSDPNNEFAKQALRKLLAPPPSTVQGAVYGCVRSVAGWSRGRRDVPGFPADVQGNNTDLTVQLSGGPYAEGASAGFFAAAGATRNKRDDTSVNDTWGNFGISANPALAERTALYGSYDVFLVRRQGDIPYRHHQAALAWQWRGPWADLLQLQGQVIAEDYPISQEMDATTFVATALAEQGVGHTGVVQASASFRWSGARAEAYDQHGQGVRLSYRRGGWGLWGLTAGVRLQRSEYPRYGDAGEGTSRVDREGGLDAEIQIPLMKQLNLIVGDAVRWTISNVGSLSGRANNGYVGLVWYY